MPKIDSEDSIHIGESTVSPAAVLFPAIIAEYGGGHRLRVDWTMNRDGFTLVNQQKEKVYETKIDGFLVKENGEPGVIIETKAGLRYETPSGRRAIQMQEASEMVGWIQCYPPAKPARGTNPTFK